tara:strand:+ start:12399 stop:12830 length:432 start_codon:yes stop_codon:yes gene_type:complete
MASTKDHPEETVAYFIVGDKLAIITTDGGDASTVHNRRGDFKAIDEAVTNGVLIHYYAEPNAVSAITDTPDVDNSMHASIVDFVKSKLYMDRAGSDPNLTQPSITLSQFHEKSFIDSLRKHGSRKRDKIGGARVIKTFDFNID